MQVILKAPSKEFFSSTKQMHNKNQRIEGFFSIRQIVLQGLPETKEAIQETNQ